MALITTLLTRWGLSAIIPYFLPGLITILFSAVIGTAWWQGYLDIPSVIIAALTVVLIGSFYTIKWWPAQLVVLAGIMVLCFLLGKIDESKLSQIKVDQAVAEVHDHYRRIAETEELRQQEEARKARERAEIERQAWQAEIDKLREALAEANEAANRDQYAERPAFGTDAVARLNKFRGNEPLTQ